jgi:hypothetical protein
VSSMYGEKKNMLFFFLPYSWDHTPQVVWASNWWTLGPKIHEEWKGSLGYSARKINKMLFIVRVQ